jgi:hypothetical protein
VTHFVLSPRDIEYRDACSKWERLSFFIKWFRRESPLKLRYKYCGHFTAYLDPNEGLAYLGGNNCENCGRGYPMPDFAWDGIDGFARNSKRNLMSRWITEYFWQHLAPDHAKEVRWSILRPRLRYLSLMPKVRKSEK